MHRAIKLGLCKSSSFRLSTLLLLALVRPVSVEAQGLDLKSGLEVYWTFDEGAGEVARDISGKARHAVVFDLPAFRGKSLLWARGKFGGALQFDATYFLAVPDYFGIGGLTPRTISMWIKTD